MILLDSFLIISLFGAFFVYPYFIYRSQSARIIKKYNLYEGNLDKHRMGFTVRALKRKLEIAPNEEAKAEIRNSIKYVRMSNYVILYPFLVFIYLFIRSNFY